MERRGTIALIVILLIVIGGMFAFAQIKRNELDTPVPQQPVDQEGAVSDEAPIPLTAKHFYIDGTHTLTGEINLPTPCHALNWDTLVQESFPEQAVVTFTTAAEGDACAQVITPQRFKVSFTASEMANVRATLDGRPVEFNLIPAAEGEDPDEFEIYIKG